MDIQQLPLQEQIRAVKREFRLMMNGIASQSMREKGVMYRTNFGIELPRLKAYSESLPHTKELAAALWKEQVRECRLLAPMLMPASDFEEDMADLWVEQINILEESECVVLHLFQHLPYASTKAFEWIAREDILHQICGWQLFGRLFMKGLKLSPRDIDEWSDQIVTTLSSEHFALKQAAYRTLLKFMDLGKQEEELGEKILETIQN